MSEPANALRSEVERASALFRTWGEADVIRDLGAGKWVRKEILGHLIDSAANNHQRFVRARFESTFTFPGYDQEDWVSAHGYRERQWKELVDLWVSLNRHVAVAIESVPPGKLQTPCTIGDHETMPLEWWMNDYLRHLKHHVDQIEHG